MGKRKKYISNLVGRDPAEIQLGSGPPEIQLGKGYFKCAGTSTENSQKKMRRLRRYGVGISNVRLILR